MKFLILFFSSFVYFFTYSSIEQANIVKEKIIKTSFKKTKVYPKDFPPYRFMLQCKNIAQKNPHQEQAHARDPQTKKLTWVNKPFSTATPLKDQEISATRCVHTAQDKNLTIKYTSTAHIEPNWQEKTFVKRKKKETIVEGPLAAIPAEFYQMHTHIKKQVKKPSPEFFGITRSIERTHTPAKLTFSVNNQQFKCHLVETIFTQGELKEVRASDSAGPTHTTPLLQDFEQQKSDVELATVATQKKEKK